MLQRFAALNPAGIRHRLGPAFIASFAAWLCAAAALAALWAAPADASPSLVIDRDTGAVLAASDATEPWYPASLTKLMTAYVVLDEMRAGRLSPDSLLVVSANAASQAPSKMGFRPGTVVTVDNALKMLLVKSANDIAVTLAEGIGGSVEGFSGMMNRAAQRLGMADSHFENPNGLPNAAHHSSAQDLAILARALLTEFPDHRDYFGIGAIELNGHVFHTFNNLYGRYPGVDGMKTGFICAGGFNTVVSATRNGRNLIAVVLGQPSATVRAVVTASLLDKAFASSGWGGLSTVTGLARVGGPPPDMHAEICGRRGKRRAVTWEQEADAVATAPCGAPAGAASGNPALETLLRQSPSGSCGTDAGGKAASPIAPIAYDAIPVFIGPAPGSANAIQPAATLATLAASPAATAKAVGKSPSVPGTAAAFAAPGGTDADILPGPIKDGATPVRLHGPADGSKTSKTAGRVAQAMRGKRRVIAARTPVAQPQPAAVPSVKAKGMAKGKTKGKLAATAQYAPSVKPAAKATKGKGKPVGGKPAAAPPQ